MIRLVRALFSDPAVRWLAASRVLALTGAVATLGLLLVYLPIAERGLWVVALNTVAIGPTFELGMGSLLVQFVAHSTEAEREQLWNAAKRWYRRAATLFGVIAFLVGLLLLPRAFGAWLPNPLNVVWWAAIVLPVVAYVRLVPSICFLEGGGAVVAVQRMRATQVAIILGTLWLGLALGFRLNAVVPAAVAQLLVVLRFLRRSRASGIGARAAQPDEGGSSAHATSAFPGEQRRSAAVWLVLWLTPQALTSALLAQGEYTDAGKLALTMALALAPPTLSVAWLQARAARYGSMVATGRIAEFERSATHAGLQAMAVLGFTVIALLMFVVAIRPLVPRVDHGLLSTQLLALLAVGNASLVVLQALLAWGRAFRDESLGYPVALACIAIIVGGIAGSVIGGAQGGIYGYVVMSIAATTLVLVPFRKLRARLVAGVSR